MNCEVVHSVGQIEIPRQFPTLAIKTVGVLFDFVKVTNLILTCVITALLIFIAIMQLVVMMRIDPNSPQYSVIHGYNYQARKPIMVSVDNSGRIVVRPEFPQPGPGGPEVPPNAPPPPKKKPAKKKSK